MTPAERWAYLKYRGATLGAWDGLCDTPRNSTRQGWQMIYTGNGMKAVNYCTHPDSINRIYMERGVDNMARMLGVPDYNEYHTPPTPEEYKRRVAEATRQWRAHKRLPMWNRRRRIFKWRTRPNYGG